ncbi:MAG: CarD family transcriptional regulator [Janthinobacterium lividum]
MSVTPLFSDGDLVVYPAHGVGKLLAVETQEVAGHELKVFVISFIKNRMTLRLPMMKARDAGLRNLSTPLEVDVALKTLRKPAVSRKMIWARRAQEYELKITSGTLTSIAEVIRDLYRSASQPEQSYSERQIYQAALQRLAAEIAAIENIDESQAAEKVESVLHSAQTAQAA